MVMLGENPLQTFISEKQLAIRIEWIIRNFPNNIFYFPVIDAFNNDYHINLRKELDLTNIHYLQFMRPSFPLISNEKIDYCLVFNPQQDNYQNLIKESVSIDICIRETQCKLLPIMHQDFYTGEIIEPNNQFIYENRDVHTRYLNFLNYNNN